MTKVILEDLKIGDRVYYIPGHLVPIPDNAEVGYITSINGDKVHVRYNGPQGNLTPIRNLYQ